MKPEIKQKWIEELRSGNYKQGKGCLKTGEQYCCLGVLCDIYRKETGQGEWLSSNDKWTRYDNFISLFIAHSTDLPLDVVEWAELKSSNPYLIDEKLDSIFANDHLNLSFDEIADVLEGKIPEKVSKYLGPMTLSSVVAEEQDEAGNQGKVD